MNAVLRPERLLPGRVPGEPGSDARPRADEAARAEVPHSLPRAGAEQPDVPDRRRSLSVRQGRSADLHAARSADLRHARARRLVPGRDAAQAGARPRGTAGARARVWRLGHKRGTRRRDRRPGGTRARGGWAALPQASRTGVDSPRSRLGLLHPEAAFRAARVQPRVGFATPASTVPGTETKVARLRDETVHGVGQSLCSYGTAARARRAAPVPGTVTKVSRRRYATALRSGGQATAASPSRAFTSAKKSGSGRTR